MEHDLFYVGVKMMFIKNGNILLLKRTDPDGKKFFDLPGGRINKGETVEDDLTREVTEELEGIQNWHIDRLVFATSFRPDESDKPSTMYLLYSGTIDDEAIVVSNEHDSYRWFPLEDVPKYSGKVIDGYRLGTQLQKALKYI